MDGNGATFPMAPDPLPPPLYARGRKIIMADAREYVLPSFTFGQLDRAAELLNGALQVKPEDWLSKDGRDNVMALVHMAFKRNYPAMTLDDLREIIDLECLPELIAIIWHANGFRELRARLGASP